MKRILLACCLAVGATVLSADLNSANAQFGYGYPSARANCYRPVAPLPNYGYRSGYSVYQQSVYARPSVGYVRSSYYAPVQPIGRYGPSPFHPAARYGYGAPIGRPFGPVGPGVSLRIGF